MKCGYKLKQLHVMQNFFRNIVEVSEKNQKNYPSNAWIFDFLLFFFGGFAAFFVGKNHPGRSFLGNSLVQGNWVRGTQWKIRREGVGGSLRGGKGSGEGWLGVWWEAFLGVFFLGK